jgi:hypothetical protein
MSLRLSPSDRRARDYKHKILDARQRGAPMGASRTLMNHAGDRNDWA